MRLNIHETSSRCAQHTVNGVIITEEIKEKENVAFFTALQYLFESLYLALYRNSDGTELNDRGSSTLSLLLRQY